MSSGLFLAKKSDHKTFAVVPFTNKEPSSPGDFTVRIRPRLLGLGKNDPIYVIGGGRLGWWAAYPVPEALAATYDPDTWCVAKAWGYAEVMTAGPGTGLQAGTFLFGWWPISTSEHVLSLEPMPAAPGHFKETDPSRQGIMSLYNHYRVEAGEPSLWMATVFTTWGTSHLLCDYVFPVDLSRRPIHPTGDGVGEWNVEDASLRSTLVVGLSTSSKSGRSFSWHLRRDRPNHPLAYLEVSTSGKTGGQASAFEAKGATYEQVLGEETLDWITKVGAKRILVVDFGARGDFSARLLEGLSAHVGAETTFTFLAIGANPAILADAGLPGRMAKGQVLTRLQGNHSGIQESAEKAFGVVEVLDGWKAAFQEWRQSEDATGYAVVEGKGLNGEGGIGESWIERCGSDQAAADTAYAFWL